MISYRFNCIRGCSGIIFRYITRKLTFTNFFDILILHFSKAIFALSQFFLGSCCKFLPELFCHFWYWNIDCQSFLLGIQIHSRISDGCHDVGSSLRKSRGINYNFLRIFLGQRCDLIQRIRVTLKLDLDLIWNQFLKSIKRWKIFPQNLVWMFLLSFLKRW